MSELRGSEWIGEALVFSGRHNPTWSVPIDSVADLTHVGNGCVGWMCPSSNRVDWATKVSDSSGQRADGRRQMGWWSTATIVRSSVDSTTTASGNSCSFRLRPLGCCPLCDSAPGAR